MTRKPIAIEIAMPSGPQHYWDAMCASPKGFTVRHIANCADGVAYETVKRYVWFCVKAGYVVKIGDRRDGYAKQAVYAVKERKTKAPIERVGDLKSPLTARQAMWNAMRALRQFTVAELSVTASTEERPVAQRTADRYVRALVVAGVLQQLEKAQANGRGSTPGRFRLAPKANSGPLAPKLCNAGFVYDMNRRAVVGETIVTEARS